MRERKGGLIAHERSECGMVGFKKSPSPAFGGRQSPFTKGANACLGRNLHNPHVDFSFAATYRTAQALVIFGRVMGTSFEEMGVLP